MKEFVEKLIGRLEEKSFRYFNEGYGSESVIKKNSAISIISQLAEEYKPQLNDNDLMIVESLPSLYPMKEFEEEALQRVIGCAKKEYNNGWIPCSERLPNMFDVVLAITEDDLFYVAVCNTTFRQWYDDNFEREIEVIAWMPLPAWKGVENGEKQRFVR